MSKTSNTTTRKISTRKPAEKTAAKPVAKTVSKPVARSAEKAATVVSPAKAAAPKAVKPKAAEPKAVKPKAAESKAAESKAKSPVSHTKAADAIIATPAEVKKATSSIKQAASTTDASPNQIIESGEKIMNDQVKQFTDLQARAFDVKQFTDLQARTFEPMRMFSAMAVDAMEKLVRKNYEVMGDIVDFSVKQAQLPVQTEDMTEIAQAKMAETTAFTELLGTRANEYVELGNQFSQKAREVTDEVVAATKAA